MGDETVGTSENEQQMISLSVSSSSGVRDRKERRGSRLSPSMVGSSNKRRRTESL
jgi:hypothetical protein